MATVDPSLVAHLPLFAGFCRRGARRNPARSPLGAISPRTARCSNRARTRIPSSCCCMAMSAPARPRRPANRSCALCRAGRDLWRRDGDRAAALSRHRDRGRRQRRAGLAVGGVAAPGGEIPGACHQHAADRRQPAAGNPYPRGRDVDRSRSSSASRMRCCGSPSNPAARSSTASRSTFRSAARTSRR